MVSCTKACKKNKIHTACSRTTSTAKPVMMEFSPSTPNAILEPKIEKQNYPEARIIVLDDNFNTFQHVANCLLKIIPGMTEKRSWDLTVKVDKTGAAEVWRGPLEQAELYHQQLVSKGITVAPIEKT